MTISGCSSSRTVMPPSTPWASTVKGRATALQSSQRGMPGTRKAATAAASVVSPTTKPATRLPNSISALYSLGGRKVSPQFGQFSQPSPEPVRRTVAPETTMRKSAASAA